MDNNSNVGYVSSYSVRLPLPQKKLTLEISKIVHTYKDSSTYIGKFSACPDNIINWHRETEYPFDSRD